jgi:hypothetical protein
LRLHRIVVALLKAGVRMIAVGDADHSIYGFTGAQPVLLRRLAEREGVTAIRLKLNYAWARDSPQNCADAFGSNLDAEGRAGRLSLSLCNSGAASIA